MSPLKNGALFIFFCFFFVVAFGNVVNPVGTKKRTQRRVHIPFLGLGPFCTGCPPHYCDDDPAIIHGYCCGCAAFYDNLPVVCLPFLNCPLNAHSLCQDYEYMMYCCCD